MINVALGFDSYLVMRHGSRSDVEQVERAVVMPGLRSIEGGQLGCYFCNDITAPGNVNKMHLQQNVFICISLSFNAVS